MDEDTKVLLFPGAKVARAVGFDEVMQFTNIRIGNMGLRGWRPYMIDEYDELMDNMSPSLHRIHELVTDHERPGLVSSNALFEHRMRQLDIEQIGYACEQPERVVELNYDDFMHGSIGYDLRTLGRVAELVMAA